MKIFTFKSVKKLHKEQSVLELDQRLNHLVEGLTCLCQRSDHYRLAEGLISQ